MTKGQKKQLNVVYFICHDIGTELGCYGKPLATPHLDKFAENGICFTNVFANSTACSPSRGCAMTGKYAHVNGQTGLAHMGHPLPENQKTIVDYLNSSGYETVHCGFSHERGAGRNHYQIDLEKADNNIDDYDAKNAVEQAICYLERKANSGRPFYLNIGTADTHISRWLWTWEERDFGKQIPPESVYVPLYIADTAENRNALSKFQTSLSYLDAHFGRLYTALDRLGYLENTIIIFTTDHGISNRRSKGTLYDRGVEVSLLLRAPQVQNNRRCACLLQNIDFAPTILEACGISIPDDMQGKSFWPLINGKEYRPHQYIFTERNFHGERIHKKERNINVFEGYAKKEKNEISLDIYDPIRAVRSEKYHYIRYFKPDLKQLPVIPPDVLGIDENLYKECTVNSIEQPQKRCAEELFAIEQDPLELVNLAKRSEYNNIKNHLSGILDEWMQKTNDCIK